MTNLRERVFSDVATERMVNLRERVFSALATEPVQPQVVLQPPRITSWDNVPTFMTLLVLPWPLSQRVILYGTDSLVTTTEPLRQQL